MSNEDEFQDHDAFMIDLHLVSSIGCHSVDERRVLEQAGFTLAEDGYWKVELGDGLEVTLEPTLFRGHVLGIYRKGQLVLERKVELDLRPRAE